MRRAIILGMAAGCVLAACSSKTEEPGAVTADEARQLNDAAAMLDANSMAPADNDIQNESTR